MAPQKTVNRRLGINLGLAVLTAALIWVVFFKPETRSGKIPYPLSTLTAASVGEITITPANRPRVVLTQRKGEWFVTEPFNARADMSRVENLLGLLSAQSANRLAAQDLTRFGLDKPLARVRVGTQEFAFGGTQPLTDQLYVLTQGAVYLISPVYFVDVAKQASDYISKQFFDDQAVPVAFTFSRFTLTRHAGQWHMTPAAALRSQDDANMFADEWRHALAMSVAPEAMPKSAEAVTVTLHSGKVVNIQITRGADEWVLRRDDTGLAYHFTPQAAKRLLEPGFAPK